MNRQEWTRIIKEDVRSTLGFLLESSQRLVVAHWALESGFGEARAAKQGFNLANLTAGPAWTGPKWTDIGGDVDGQGRKINQEWRMYPDVRAFAHDYWRFLGPMANRGRYAYARVLIERGMLIYAARELHKAGYFELPALEYKKRWEATLAQVTSFLAA